MFCAEECLSCGIEGWRIKFEGVDWGLYIQDSVTEVKGKSVPIGAIGVQPSSYNIKAPFVRLSRSCTTLLHMKAFKGPRDLLSTGKMSGHLKLLMSISPIEFFRASNHVNEFEALPTLK